MRYVLPGGAFWEVSLVGKAVHARWGKGDAVKTRKAPFKTIALARHELEVLIKKVTGLGYRAQERRGGVAEALRSRPADDSPLIVHADELLSEGDLRGELAALVSAGKKAQLGRFLLKHAPALFGASENDVHEGAAGELVWAPGFVREVTFATPDTSDADELVAVTRRFMSAPVAEFLREVNFGLSYESWGAAVEQVTRARHPELITALRFDAFDAHEVMVENIDAGDFGEVWPRLPELRELKVVAGAMDPGELVLPQLRSFSRLGSLSGAEMRAITRARWPKLERLELGFQENDPSLLLAWLFQNPGALRDLALRGLALSPEQIEGLLDSELLPRLRTLDLSDVVLDEEAAEALRDGAEALARLERFASPWLSDEAGEPTMQVLDELENGVDDAFEGG